MGEKRNYLSLFTGKDKFNNSGLDYLQAFTSRGGEVNNLAKPINNKVNVLSMLSEALREVGKNAPNHTQPQSTAGGMVSGFYVPGTAVKKNPFITMLNIVKDGAGGALNNANAQIETINQAETFRNALSKVQEQETKDREDKDRSLRILENKSKLDSSKNDALSKAKIAKYEADTKRSQLAAKEIEFKHDKNNQEQIAHLKRFVDTAGHIYDNLSQMDESYFGVGKIKEAKRMFSSALGNKNAQLFANLEQIKNNDIPPILKGIGGGNMLVDEKIIKGLLSIESTKANNAKNIVELLVESVNKIPQNLKEAHPELMKEFNAKIAQLKSLYDSSYNNVQGKEKILSASDYKERAK